MGLARFTYPVNFSSSGLDFQHHQLSNTFLKECHHDFCLGMGFDLEVGKVEMNIKLFHCCFTQQDPKEGWDASKNSFFLLKGVSFNFHDFHFSYLSILVKNEPQRSGGNKNVVPLNFASCSAFWDDFWLKKSNLWWLDWRTYGWWCLEVVIPYYQRHSQSHQNCTMWSEEEEVHSLKLT